MRIAATLAFAVGIGGASERAARVRHVFVQAHLPCLCKPLVTLLVTQLRKFWKGFHWDGVTEWRHVAGPLGAVKMSSERLR